MVADGDFADGGAAGSLGLVKGVFLGRYSDHEVKFAGAEGDVAFEIDGVASGLKVSWGGPPGDQRDGFRTAETDGGDDVAERAGQFEFDADFPWFADTE